MPIAKTLIKHCEQCSALMTRVRFNGRLEDFSVFQRRKFCNQDCMAKAMLKPPCEHCGKPSYRAGVCNTCRTQIRRHGAPRPKTSALTC